MTVNRVTRKELDRIQRMPTEADVARLVEELELAWAERDRAREQLTVVPMLTSGPPKMFAQHPPA
jgi:hypothetical protein